MPDYSTTKDRLSILQKKRSRKRGLSEKKYDAQRIDVLKKQSVIVEEDISKNSAPLVVDGTKTALHLKKDKAYYAPTNNLEGLPQEDNELVNKLYVDDAVASAGGGASALDDLSDVTYSSGDLTISSLDKIITSGSLTLDSASDIELNADSGTVNVKDGSNAMASITQGALQLSPNSFGDWCRITSTTHGATTIATNDVDGAVGHLTLDSNGDIALDSDSGNFIAKKGGTEFSADNSAYAGMILGYTCLRGDGTNMSTFEIQNSLTVEDATHKINFKTPPSENVEIEAIFLVNASSTDTRIAVGLSDSSTYNAVSQIHEYDGNAVWFTDDEVDDSLITVKFVLTSTELASIGSNNEYWIGISTDGVTKTAYLTYGLRSAFGIGEHPFIIKATALPATIYDGT